MLYALPNSQFAICFLIRRPQTHQTNPIGYLAVIHGDRDLTATRAWIRGGEIVTVHVGNNHLPFIVAISRDRSPGLIANGASGLGCQLFQFFQPQKIGNGGDLR
jgi:hypothetical protein